MLVSEQSSLIIILLQEMKCTSVPLNVSYLEVHIIGIFTSFGVYFENWMLMDYLISGTST
jgi:hypothetical protein